MGGSCVVVAFAAAVAVVPAPARSSRAQETKTGRVTGEGSCGPAPPGMKMIAHTCMGAPSKCTGDSCDCAANVQLSSGACSPGDECFRSAKTACEADKACKSFAVLGPPCSNYTTNVWQT
eukprot:COSAG02_NODE_27555_length_607_cov_0.624016_1_plen_119_part_01